MMKYLYESKDPYFICKCYVSDNGKIVYETNSCGMDLQFFLSGHPYEPVLYAECNISRYSLSIHGGLWFPDKNYSSWKDFCEKLSDEINQRVAWLHNLPDEYRVDFNHVKSNKSLQFKGETLHYCFFPKKNINSRYLEPALEWHYPNFPADKDAKVIGGGCPGEYYIMISELTAKQKMTITTVDGHYIVKKRKSYNDIMDRIINGGGPYDLETDLKYKGILFTPTALEIQHGFTERIEEGGIKEHKKSKIVRTTADGIIAYCGGQRPLMRS